MKQPLEELLRTMKTMPGATPTKSFRDNARVRILNLVSVPAPHGSAVQRMGLPYHLARFVGGLALASTLVGGAVVYAAQYSKPGGVLYPVKIASENAAIQIAPTSSLKTAVATEVIDRRAKDIEQLQSATASAVTQHAVEDYQDFADSVKHLHGIDLPEVQKHLDAHADLLPKRVFQPDNREDRGDSRSDSRKSGDVRENSLVPTTSAMPPGETRNDGRQPSTEDHTKLEPTPVKEGDRKDLNVVPTLVVGAQTEFPKTGDDGYRH